MLSHLDDKGNPRMVDVSQKVESNRLAKAMAKVFFPPAIFDTLRTTQFQSSKGSVISTAIIAGTKAAKQTSNLIPFCHPLPIHACNIDIEVLDEFNALQIEASVSTFGRTGVEMEALTAVSLAALCVYDMCKALSHEIIISEIRLITKTGGKSNFTNE